jgi:hypothetical protein
MSRMSENVRASTSRKPKGRYRDSFILVWLNHVRYRGPHITSGEMLYVYNIFKTRNVLMEHIEISDKG